MKKLTSRSRIVQTAVRLIATVSGYFLRFIAIAAWIGSILMVCLKTASDQQSRSVSDMYLSWEGAPIKDYFSVKEWQLTYFMSRDQDVDWHVHRVEDVPAWHMVTRLAAFLLIIILILAYYGKHSKQVARALQNVSPKFSRRSWFYLGYSILLVIAVNESMTYLQGSYWVGHLVIAWLFLPVSSAFVLTSAFGRKYLRFDEGKVFKKV